MIVEDGTGLTDSNSYVSVVFADNYFSIRGVSAWAEFEDEQKEQYLIRATDYIDNVFKWNGKKVSNSQALRFPRSNLVDYEGQTIEGVPSNLKQAVCDMALIISEGTDLFQVANENGEVTSEKIGELSFSYAKRTSGVTGITLYDSVNTKLRGLYQDPTNKKIIVGNIKRV